MNKIEFRNPQGLKENKYSRHVFPALEGKQYDLLKEDIKEKGIRIPIDITKDNVILCGHERVKIAVELGFETVPVNIFPSDSARDQRIHIIKDNLARKSIDFNTRYKCFGELKELYGLKERENVPIKGKKGFQKASNVRSEESTLTEEDIAKEVGIHEVTFRRAQKIQKSDLPKIIKKAVFKGNLPVRPVADILDKPDSVKQKIIKKIEEEIDREPTQAVSVAPIVRSVESEEKITKTLKEIGVPSVGEQVEQFYDKLPAPKTQKQETMNHKDLIQFILGFLERKDLKCPICGETNLTWKCGHEFK